MDDLDEIMEAQRQNQAVVDRYLERGIKPTQAELESIEKHGACHHWGDPAEPHETLLQRLQGFFHRVTTKQ